MMLRNYGLEVKRESRQVAEKSVLGIASIQPEAPFL